MKITREQVRVLCGTLKPGTLHRRVAQLLGLSWRPSFDVELNCEEQQWTWMIWNHDTDASFKFNDLPWLRELARKTGYLAEVWNAHEEEHLEAIAAAKEVLLGVAQVPLSEHLAIDPDVSAESPVIKGTWVTVAHLISLIVDGWSWSNILRTHPELTEDDIRAALAYTEDTCCTQSVTA